MSSTRAQQAEILELIRAVLLDFCVAGTAPLIVSDERIDALEAGAAALRSQDQQEGKADAGWEDVDGDNAEYVNRVTAVVREADRTFEKVGGSSRHWVRDVFLPLLNKAGLFIAHHVETCQHCGEDIRQDSHGDWMDRETHTTCDTPQALHHRPLPPLSLRPIDRQGDEAQEQTDHNAALTAGDAESAIVPTPEQVGTCSTEPRPSMTQLFEQMCKAQEVLHDANGGEYSADDQIILEALLAARDACDLTRANWLEHALRLKEPPFTAGGSQFASVDDLLVGVDEQRFAVSASGDGLIDGLIDHLQHEGYSVRDIEIALNTGDTKTAFRVCEWLWNVLKVGCVSVTNERSESSASLPSEAIKAHSHSEDVPR